MVKINSGILSVNCCYLLIFCEKDFLASLIINKHK